MKTFMLCSYLFFVLVPLKKSLHMFQQNRYRNDRYLPWLKQQLYVLRKHLVKTVLLLFLIYGLFFKRSISPAVIKHVAIDIWLLDVAQRRTK